jgi:hydrogenase maturation protease
MTRILVAGVGNIFLGDDAFGVEVVQALAARPPASGVEYVDVGIGGVHLAYRLLDGYDLLVLVDAAPIDEAPGAIEQFTVDPDAPQLTGFPLPTHGVTPQIVLRSLAALGGSVGAVLVVACRPAVLEEGIGLSEAVRAGVPAAVAMVEEIVADPRRYLVRTRA